MAVPYVQISLDIRFDSRNAGGERFDTFGRIMRLVNRVEQRSHISKPEHGLGANNRLRVLLHVSNAAIERCRVRRRPAAT